MNGLYALHNELGRLYNNGLYNEMGPLHSDLVHLW
jgi:hypothetical protein